MNDDFQEQGSPLVELPQSGLMRILGKAMVVKIYQGKMCDLRAAIPADVTFGTGELKGWVFSRAEIVDDHDGHGRLLVYWLAGKGTFLCRPSNIAEVVE